MQSLGWVEALGSWQQPTLQKDRNITIRIVSIRIIRKVNTFDQKTQPSIDHNRRCIRVLCLANYYPQTRVSCLFLGMCHQLSANTCATMGWCDVKLPNG